MKTTPLTFELISIFCVEGRFSQFITKRCVKIIKWLLKTCCRLGVMTRKDRLSCLSIILLGGNDKNNSKGYIIHSHEWTHVNVLRINSLDNERKICLEAIKSTCVIFSI